MLRRCDSISFQERQLNAKRRRLNPTREDIISKLSEILRDSILEHLSIFDAVRTIVLSKTWRYVWKIHQHEILDQCFR